jgi:hypothetical protein
MISSLTGTPCPSFSFLLFASLFIWTAQRPSQLYKQINQNLKNQREATDFVDEKNHIMIASEGEREQKASKPSVSILLGQFHDDPPG